MSALRWLTATLLALLRLASPSWAEEPTPSWQPGQVFRDCPTCPEMVVIPPGSGETYFPGLGPPIRRHFTIAKPFAIGRFEVKRSEYQAFVKATGYRDKRCEADLGGWVGIEVNWRNPNFKQDGSHPVVCVSWPAVHAYLGWLSKKAGKTYRLPSLAEWEWAAHGPNPKRYPWGDTFDYDHANLNSYAYREPPWREDAHDQWDFTAPVGSFPANAFGLFDAIGNVGEWVADCTFREDPRRPDFPTDGSAWIRSPCIERLTLGSSWKRNPEWAAWPESGLEIWFDDSGAIWIGMRVARTL